MRKLPTIAASAAAAFDRFFLSPAGARPLAAARIGAAAILLLQAYLLRGAAMEFLSAHGMIQGDLARFLSESGTPQLSFLTDLFARAGVGERSVIGGFCLVYLASLACLMVGWKSRASAGLAWFTHWVLVSTAASTSYGVDLYAHFTLFYLIWSPSGDAWSIDAWLAGNGAARVASWNARLMLRVIQLHLCISYLCSSIEKAQGPQWWNGELLWRALNLPEYRQYDFLWLARWPVLAQWMGLGSLALEAGYVLMIWPRRTRKLWLAGVVGMHLGIAVFLGLGTFGLFMAMLNIAVFGIPAEPEAEFSVAIAKPVTLGHADPSRA